MAPRTPKTPGTTPAERRDEALSRERIVEAAVELLDAAGEAGLTFRALSARLSTGPGAIYWHVAGKGELLAAAAEAVLAGTVPPDTDAAPEEAIRELALGVFDAITTHPWVGNQLAGAVSQRPALLGIFEGIGRQVTQLGVRREALFDAASALLTHVVGAGVQHVAAGRTIDPETNRNQFLDDEAQALQNLDAHAYPFTRAIADQMLGHDDRSQFLAGVDLIVAGIRASVGAASGHPQT